MHKQRMNRKEKKNYSWIGLVITAAVSCVGFAVAHEYAILERGYNAIGGELLLLWLPIIFSALKAIYS